MISPAQAEEIRRRIVQHVQSLVRGEGSEAAIAVQAAADPEVLSAEEFMWGLLSCDR
jgi:hypothetical protein